jgi:hypothetical protein
MFQEIRAFATNVGSPIKSIKSTAAMLKDYVSIFNVDEFKKFQEIREHNLSHEFEQKFRESSIELASEISDKSIEIFHESYYEQLRLILEFLWTSVPETDWEIFLDDNLPSNKDFFLHHLRQSQELLNKYFGRKATSKE